MSTGDRGILDDAGRLAVLGREDDMILSGGENVYPQEVEDLLLSHPQIDDAAVLGVPDDEFGERLAAYLVLTPGSALGGDEVRAHVKSRLARYKTPRDVVFIDEIPRNASGKILRRALRDRPSPATS